jgi:outer membrane protein assembly factor BamB
MDRLQIVLLVVLGIPLTGGVGTDSPGIDTVVATGESSHRDAPSADKQWFCFRGDQALQGVADVDLPDRLTLKWTFKTGAPIKSSAVIADGKVLIGSDDGHVYAVDAATGQQIWIYKTGQLGEEFMEDPGPVEAPPLVLGSVVYVGGDDAFFHALNVHTGELKWRFAAEDRIVGSANWATAPDGQRNLILFGSYDNRLYCLDAVTGGLQWTYQSDYYINGAPAIADGKIVFGGCDEILHVVSIIDGTKLQHLPVAAPIAGSAAISDRRAYFGHYGNAFVAANIDTGQVDWVYKDREFAYFSSPAVNDRFVVFGGRDRRVHCLQRTDGQLAWVFPTRGRVDSSPVITGDKVVVGSEDGRLYLIGLSDGTERWSYEIGEAITGSPAVAEGLVVIGADDGLVYAFGPKHEGTE